MPRKLIIVSVLLILATWSCNHPFDPRGPLDKQLNVYAVLSTDRDVQYVRVNSSYMPHGIDPSEYAGDNAVRDAAVWMYSSGSTWTFHDSSVARPDTSRYKSPIFMYALRQFRPVRGRMYQIGVNSPSFGVASGSTVIPSAGIANVDSGLTLFTSPFSLGATSSASVTVYLSIGKGYSYHLYLYYDVLQGSKWVEERVEIPESSFGRVATINPDSTFSVGLIETPESKKVTLEYFTRELTSRIKRISQEKYGNTHVFFKWLSLVVLSADENLFNYYTAVQGSKDPLSIRLDQPFFSNVTGGIGFIGSYGLDSLTVVLPGNFSGNR